MRSFIPLFAAISTLSALDVSPCGHPHRPPVLDGGANNLLAVHTDGGGLSLSEGVGASSIATSVATAPVIGPRAPAPTPPKLDHAQTCKVGTPAVIGEAKPIPMPTYVPTFAIAFGPNDGLIAYEKTQRHLVVQPIGKDGHPVGAPHEIDAPGKLDRVLGMRRLADVFVVFLNEMNFGTAQLNQSVYAAVFKPDGTPLGAPALLDIGHHAAVHGASAGAAHGFMIYEGPSNQPLPGRLVTALVNADGSVTQSASDLAFSLKPGVLATDPEFSLGSKHSVARIDEHLVVDGKLLTIATTDPNADAFSIGENMDDKGAATTIPIITSTKETSAFVGTLGTDGKLDATKVTTSSASSAKIRYGKIDLDGTLHLDAKPAAAKDPIKAPFVEEADWTINGNMGGAGDVMLSADTSLRHAPFVASFKAAAPDISSGMWTKIEWSGDKFVMLYSAGISVRTAPLDCTLATPGP